MEQNMEDLNLVLFNKLRDYDRYMRMNRAPGALLADGSFENPAFQRDIILELLSENEKGLSQRQLAQQMRISPSTLSVMLDKLEADGYVERKSDPDDKRVKLLTNTGKGEERAGEVHKQCVVMREQLYKNLTDDEKQELIRLLDKILDSDENESEPSPFQMIGEGMTCGPDGCHSG